METNLGELAKEAKKTARVCAICTLLSWSILLGEWSGTSVEKHSWIRGLTREQVEQSFEERYGLASIPKGIEGNPAWERRSELKLAFFEHEVPTTPAYSSVVELEIAAEEGKQEQEGWKEFFSTKREQQFRRE